MIRTIGNQIRGKWNSGKRFLPVALMFLVACMSGGFGKHPAPLFSARDIKAASANTERIVIPFLPLEDYPLLSKFKRLKAVRFYANDGTGGSDEKLAALANLKLSYLHDVTLLNCPLVTDLGIQHLSRIESLRLLQLEGTSITDEALEIMATKMNLTGVNVSNCPKVTMKGLLKLARSETLKEFGFSSNDLSQEEVVRLIREFRTITWCGIVDPSGKLGTEALKALGKEKGVRVVIKRTGALQNVPRR